MFACDFAVFKKTKNDRNARHQERAFATNIENQWRLRCFGATVVVKMVVLSLTN